MSRADDIGALIVQSFPGVRVTSTNRSRAEQDALIASGATKARNSQHLSGNGLDVVLPRNVSPAQIRSFLNDRGISPGEFLNERGGPNQGTGTHLHIGLAPKSAPAKGGDPASRSDPVTEVRAWRQNRDTGPDVSQYPDLRQAASSRLRPSSPVPPEVINSYNTHQMSDEDRAVVDKYVGDGTWYVPKGQILKRPAPRTVGERLGMGVRDIATGVGGLADVVAGPLNIATNAAISPFTDTRLSTHPFTDAANNMANAVGLAKPESDTENMISAINQGGTQGLATAGLGMAAAPIEGATGVIGRAVGSNPILDTISGATSGAAQETARQAGAGPVGQIVAGIAGGGVPIGGAAAVERVAARAPRTLPEIVAETPRAAVIDEQGNLTPHGQEVAARTGATPEEVHAAYEAPPSVREGTANDQLPEVTARQATTGEPVPEAIPTRETPEAAAQTEVPERTELPPQPNAPQDGNGPDVSLPALARVQQAGEFGVDLTRGQATKSFDVQDAEQRLRNSNGSEGEVMRQFVAKQTEQVKQAAEQFKSAFDDTAMTPEDRGRIVQDAIRELRDNGQAGVNALYRQARELGQEVPLDTKGLRNTFEGLMAEADIPESVKKVMEQEAARYGLIGKPQIVDKTTGAVTNEAGVTTVKLDDGQTIKFRGEPQTLRLDNAEDFRKVISKQYAVDGPQKLTQELKRAIDDATEQAAEKLAQYHQEGARVPEAMQKAREAHVQQVKTFRAKDVVQKIVDWKKGAEDVTGALSPEQVVKTAFANTSDLKRIKAVLLSRPTEASKAAWRALQAHGLAEVFEKATTRTTNPAGEITDAISGQKLRSSIQSFGQDKLKVLLEPEQYNQLMRLKGTIEDATIPISGTVNTSNSGNLIMRLVKDVDNQVTAAFAAAGTAIAGPAGTAIGGTIGRTISPAIKAAKEGRAAAETLAGATEYTAERAATDTGEKAPSVAAKVTSAAKDAGQKTIRAFIDTYSSPRVLAPVLATTSGANKE